MIFCREVGKTGRIDAGLSSEAKASSCVLALAAEQGGMLVYPPKPKRLRAS